LGHRCGKGFENEALLIKYTDNLHMNWMYWIAIISITAERGFAWIGFSMWDLVAYKEIQRRLADACY
jgi:hypothetical protein